jgi:hypothetical protein
MESWYIHGSPSAIAADYKVPDGTLVNMHLQPTPPQKSASANPTAAKPISEEGRPVLRLEALFHHIFLCIVLLCSSIQNPRSYPLPNAVARSV